MREVDHFNLTALNWPPISSSAETGKGQHPQGPIETPSYSEASEFKVRQTHPCMFVVQLTGVSDANLLVCNYLKKAAHISTVYERKTYGANKVIARKSV